MRFYVFDIIRRIFIKESKWEKYIREDKARTISKGEGDRFISNCCTKCNKITEIWFYVDKNKYSDFLENKDYIRCLGCQELIYVEGWLKEIYAIATRKERKKR